MLTIAKLSRWSINYYNDTARAAGQAATDAQRANGGLGEYYSERDTRTPVWLCAGDAHQAAELVGLSDVQRAGGEADPEVVARWLDDGVAPNGECGRGVHGFDLTFCAPKSVSLIRAVRGDDVADKAVADAHATALSEAMEYLAPHAGYTRVHNPVTGEKDLVRLPGLVAIAYQHETSRAGDPHLHTHVIVPNRQARADGRLVALDGTSLYHEAKAAGVLYQATLRRELHRSLGLEWAPIDPGTGMAELLTDSGLHTPDASDRRRCLVSRQTRHASAANLVEVFPQLVVSHFLSRSACLKSSVSVGGETVCRMTAILGYGRVSTLGQDLDVQLAALSAAGIDPGRVFTDKLSGSAKAARPGLAAMLDYARPGDTVVVSAVDRLGRSVAEVTRTIADLGERSITLRALREGVDTGTPTGRAVAAIMATLAELELELGRERRAASRESRRSRRLPATKPPKLSAERQDQLRRLAATGEPVRALAEAFGIGRATAYRYLSRAALCG
jgi:conjugative relaxase-like TrwC/TraI family protein